MRTAPSLRRLALATVFAGLPLAASADGAAPLRGDHIDRTDFANPYAHIPAQC